MKEKAEKKIGISGEKIRGAAAGVVFVTLIILWGCRVWAVNQYYGQKYDNVETIYYDFGMPIALNSSLIEYNITADGYIFTFDTWEILSHDEFEKKYGISVDSYYDESWLVVVEVTAENENNIGDQIPLYDFLLHGVDWVANDNDLLMQEMNNNNWNLFYSIEPGTTDHFYLVYEINRGGMTERRWSKITEETMQIEVAYYPAIVRVKLQ